MRTARPLSPLLVVLFGIGAGCGDTTGPPLGEPGIQVLSGDEQSDTIQSVLPDPVIVRVLGSNGRPRAGVTVRFEANIASAGYEPRPWVWLGAVDGPGYAMQSVATTDGNGNASVRVRFGTRAGEGGMTVIVPALGFQDTVSFTIQPGARAGVRAVPVDTVAYVGGEYALRGAVVDRHENPRADPVTYDVVRGDIEIAGGTLSGRDISRGVWTVRNGTYVDTGWVTIVPQGQYAALREFRGTTDTAAVVVMNFDGTVAHQFETENWSRPGPDWSPSGDALVIESGGTWSGNDHHVVILGLNGERQRLVSTATAVTQQFTPRFSADGAWVFFTGIPLMVDDGSLPNDYGRQEIWKAKRNGEGLARVGPSATYHAGDWSPAPSPDGRYLAYLTNRVDASGGTLRIMNLETGEVNDFGAAEGSPLLATTPAWSPASLGLVAYGAQHPGIQNTGALQIVVMAADGSGKRLVTERAYRASFGWSPDARWILAQSYEHERLELIEVTTGRVLPLPFTARLAQPSWKP